MKAVRITLAFVISGSAGCIGAIDAPAANCEGCEKDAVEHVPFESMAAVECEGGPSVGFAPMARLTEAQIQTALEHAFGDAAINVADAGGLPALINTQTQVSVDDASAFQRIAEAQAVKLEQNLGQFLNCDVGAIDDECAHAYIEGMGLRLFRRPLSDDESTWLFDSYAAFRSEPLTAEPSEALTLVVEVMLQSSPFMHQMEQLTLKAMDGIYARSSHALASKLSFFLLGEPPSMELLGMSKDELMGVAQDMAVAPEGRDTTRAFARSFVGADELMFLTEKDPVRFPGFADLREPMVEELVALFQQLFWDDEGTVDQVLTDNRAYVNGPLADHYGVAGPQGPDDFAWVELPKAQRAGLLTRAGLMARLAHTATTSPTHRGIFVREQILGEHLPNVPDDVVVTVPEPGEYASMRDVVNARMEDVFCGSCHQHTDLVGLGFEQFDPTGRWVTQDPDTGTPLKGTGTLKNYGGGDDLEFGEFDGAVELSQNLARSDKFRTAFAKAYYQNALSRVVTHEDACAVEQLTAHVEQQGEQLSALRTGLTTLDSFFYFAVPETNEGNDDP